MKCQTIDLLPSILPIRAIVFSFSPSHDTKIFGANPMQASQPGIETTGETTSAEAQRHLAAPVREANRLLPIDAMRGLAILGILAMNIQYFSQVSAAYLNPALSGPLTGADYWIWLINHELFDEKMMGIFSMLYGAGIVLLCTNIESRGVRPLGIFVRRSLWLMLFGILHAYLIWSGDILFSYAVCGLLVYPMRKWSAKRLLVAGVLALGMSSVLFFGYLQALHTWPAAQVQETERQLWRPSQQEIAAEVDAYRGGWKQQMTARVPDAELLEGQGLLFLTLWRAGGLMLIGMACYKFGLLTGSLSIAQYRRSGIEAFLIGIAVVSYGVHRDFAAHWGFPYAFFIGSQFNYWGSLAIVWSWICLVQIACKTPAMRPVTTRFAKVGRMAFSNYILETLICTTIFYGHGFGMFGRFNRAQGLAVVFATWIFLFVFAQVWLRYFYSGPLEWAWRSLTYWRLQPFKRVAATT
jgi:uncharacterized protein